MDDEVTQELVDFLGAPMSRQEVLMLVQPLRAAILPVFHGAMTSLAITAIHSEDEVARSKAREAFDELREVFAEIDRFDMRVGRLLEGRSDLGMDEGEPTNE